MFVADVQTGMHPLAQDAGAGTARGGADDFAGEDQLHSVRAAQIQIVADDFLEELSAGHRAIHDLGEADFQLADRELVIIAGSAVAGRERQGEPIQPFGEENFELCWPQRIGQLLKAFGVLTTQEAVVQRLKADAFLSQLAFEPFVAVEVELQTPRSVAADLEEGFAPLAVIQIEVVVVGDDGFEALRSEEHTSELQSRFDLVCRLLLEKKKYKS